MRKEREDTVRKKIKIKEELVRRLEHDIEVDRKIIAREKREIEKLRKKLR